MTDFVDVDRGAENLEDVWGHDQFKERIVKAVKTHDIPKSELPRKIDLNGNIGNWLGKISSETSADPQKRERLAYAKVDEGGSMWLSVIKPGEATHASGTVKFRSSAEYIAFTAHSHGVADVPPSPIDAKRLLLLTEDYGEQCSFILTPTVDILVVRTNETPYRTREEVEAYITSYDSRLETALKSDVEGFSKHMAAFTRQTGIPLSMDLAQSQSTGRQTEIQRAMFFEACAENKLEIYTSPSGKNTFIRASA